MAQAFNDYYKRFTRERAGKGLLVECASGYNKWTLNSWYNIADFSRDPVTRQRMKMFLDLYWADWAIEQIDAVRAAAGTVAILDPAPPRAAMVAMGRAGICSVSAKPRMQIRRWSAPGQRFTGSTGGG